jgi:hypothetical protein
MKICKKCGNKKTLDEFCNCNKARDGKQSWCKACKNTQLIDYYKKNPHKRSSIPKSKESNRKAYHRHAVHMNISRMMRRALNEEKKSKPTFEALGYSLDELKAHLEGLFAEGMSWNNYGEWHIDHIYPQSKLPYNSVEHPNFKECWKLDNLQPLWAKNNQRKGAS